MSADHRRSKSAKYSRLFTMKGAFRIKSPLKILHLEDDPHDAAFIQSILGVEGISCETLQAETKNDFTGIQNAGITITVVIRKDKDRHS
jgi:hypothetical protein